MKILFRLLILLLPVFSSCKQDTGSVKQEAVSTDCSYLDVPERGVQSGGVKMITIDGKYKVWTKRFGKGEIKVLLLHGGPALTHEYMECFESFFPKAGIEFYEYDQLGSYYSDQPEDSSFWTTERFVEEVEQVRKGLELDKDHFYLLGSSWGGILAMEYALKYQDNLKGLVISNMVASIPRYEQYNNKLRSEMRKSLIDSLEVFERKGDFQNPVYVSLVEKEYYHQHICRLSEWPDALNRSFKHINPIIYVMMQGPSEFKTGGRLLHWDRWNDLQNIHVPTLMVGAKYDTMNPEEMEAMSKQVPHGRYLYCPDGSHLSMWDDQEHYYPGIIQFLKDVQGGSFPATN
ncbi:MAG: proline iminopeptidase-family hydrolase [Chitinophagales bacterium]